MTNATEHELTKWRRLLTLRDKDFCVMCHRQTKIWQLQAHHVLPKSLYPDLALDLDNGVMLCVGCHMGVVHAGNSTVDIADLSHWKFFVPSFQKYLASPVNRCYKEINQQRLTTNQSSAAHDLKESHDSTTPIEIKPEDGDSSLLRIDLSDT